MLAALICSGLVAPAVAEDGVRVRKYDRQVLSEIAQDVLRRAQGFGHSKPESARAPGYIDETGTADEPVAPAAHIAPAQEGITVALPPGFVPGPKIISELAPAGYQSNTWRQRPAHPEWTQLLVGHPFAGVGARPRAESPRAGTARPRARRRVRLSPAAGPAGRGFRANPGRPGRAAPGSTSRSMG